MPDLDKASLREHTLDRVRSLSPSERSSRSSRLASHLSAILAHEQPARVLAFVPLDDEPDLTGALWSAPNPEIILPRITGRGTMSLHHVLNLADLVPHSTIPNLREPDPSRCPETRPGEIDLALVPGVAFNLADGSRLGRGGGFYDRLLAHGGFRATTIGICFGVQLAPSLPRETHDRCVDAVLTEDGLSRVELP